MHRSVAKSLLTGTWLVAALVACVALPAHGETGQPSIAASDLFSERDLEVIGERLARSYSGQRWLPYAPDYVAAHASEPEHPNMRPEFAIWVKSVLAPQWLPADLPDSAIYLRVGKHRESRYRSCFYATYAIDGTTFMVKGYLDSVQVIIKPRAASSPDAVAAAFGEAVALAESREPGALGVPQAYESADSGLRSYLRTLAVEYVNPVSVPQDEKAWATALAHVSVYNGGFWASWLTSGYGLYARPQETDGRRESVLVVLWTNGRAIRLTLDHSDVWIHSFDDYLDTFPKPVPAPVEPLNPQAVELWDHQRWASEVGPVADPQRATRASILVVVKPPFAPSVGAEGGGRASDGAPVWGTHVALPLTTLKWHVAEFAALLSATKLNVSSDSHQYDSFLTEKLAVASDRRQVLKEATAHRDACGAIAQMLAGLRYPLEMQVERDDMLAALRANAEAWRTAVSFWEGIVNEYPEASESFYRLQGEVLKETLVKADLADAASSSNGQASNEGSARRGCETVMRRLY